MGFLPNDGDIVLDAVLTDTGRFRLAKGDGSFKIAKFALGDDEIDYALYDKNHASGSAYYDLTILQTPIMEALTDNAASLKSRLTSIPRTNLLYLPVLKVNDLHSPQTALHSLGAFMVAVNKATEVALTVVNNQPVNGFILGESLEGGSHIRLDQGLDTTEITPAVTIDSDLVETQYIIEIDNRLGKIASVSNGKTAKVSFIDDDNVASYYLSLGTDIDYVSENEVRETKPNQIIAGPRGNTLKFTIQASLDLNTSDFLFTTLGSQTTMDPSATAVHKLDSIVRVTGATTGNVTDIPVRFVKLV